MTELLDAIPELLRLGLLGKLALAVVLGGAIGLEREVRGKAAGLRTNILICLGAVLFTDLSIGMAGPTGDPARIAAQVVTGVGFLGAGTILQSRGTVVGLTSAATIWLVAAIGVAIGAGATIEAAGSTLLVVLILAVLGALERRVRGVATVRHIAIEVARDPERVKEIEDIVRSSGLRIDELHTREEPEHILMEIVARGPEQRLDKAKVRLMRAARSVRVSVED